MCEQTAFQTLLGRCKSMVEGLLWSTEVTLPNPKKEEKLSSSIMATQEQELKALLGSFSKVFREPHGLPPRRCKEHAINLVKAQGLVNVRPYRHPHHHKDEIEKQVQQLLCSGVIRSSQSTFSRPFIFVKKDDTWRIG